MKDESREAFPPFTFILPPSSFILAFQGGVAKW